MPRVPVPLRLIDGGDPLALSPTLTVADFTPVAIGVNVTEQMVSAPVPVSLIVTDFFTDGCDSFDAS